MCWLNGKCAWFVRLSRILQLSQPLGCSGTKIDYDNEPVTANKYQNLTVNREETCINRSQMV